MGKWNRICSSFEEVRTMLEEDVESTLQCMRIMYALEGCCDELTQNGNEDWIFYDDFRDLKSEIHETVELMDEDDYESCEETVNCYLREMYDLCDSAGVWLGI